jgi:hypothetical protein
MFTPTRPTLPSTTFSTVSRAVMATSAARLVFLVLAFACFTLPAAAKSVMVGILDPSITWTGSWREQGNGGHTFTHDIGSTATFKFKGESIWL